jgi:flavodoxin
MKVQCLFFSPTGNTRKVVEAISKGTGYPQAKPIDLTLPKQRESWSGKIDGDMLIVGVPVYSSTFPAVIYGSLKKLKGRGMFGRNKWNPQDAGIHDTSRR